MRLYLFDIFSDSFDGLVDEVIYIFYTVFIDFFLLV
jgi:hypothetical protein